MQLKKIKGNNKKLLTYNAHGLQSGLFTRVSNTPTVSRRSQVKLCVIKKIVL